MSVSQETKTAKDTDALAVRREIVRLRDKALAIQAKAYELNNRVPTQGPGDVEIKEPQEGRADFGLQTQKDLGRINTILAQALNTLERFI